MSVGIKCCKGCIAPKRHSGCHSKCPEYLKEKEAWEEKKKAVSKQRKTDNDVYEQRSESMRKALKRKRR